MALELAKRFSNLSILIQDTVDTVKRAGTGLPKDSRGKFALSLTTSSRDRSSRRMSTSFVESCTTSPTSVALFFSDSDAQARGEDHHSGYAHTRTKRGAIVEGEGDDIFQCSYQCHVARFWLSGINFNRGT